VLHRFVTVGTYDEIAGKLCNRFGDVLTDVEFSIAVSSEDDRAVLADIARRVQGHLESRARQALAE
jgi:hypothetical protein